MFYMLDSSGSKPTAAMIAAARASGVGGWNGYLATRSNVNLGAPWSRDNFRTAAQLPAPPIAYVSGWDDPAALRATALSWGNDPFVRLCLDNEDGIRPDGGWVQPFLDALGGGHYGNAPVFNGRRAAFAVIADYPYSGDPHATWPSYRARPAVPCGWQWRGTHTEWGASVDRGTFDPWFLSRGGSSVALSQSFKLAFARILFILLRGAEPTVEGYGWWASKIADDGSNLDAIAASMLDSPEGVTHLIAVAKAVQLASDPNTTVALADALAAKAEIDALTVRLNTNEAVDTAAAADIVALRASVESLTTAVARLVDTPSGVDVAKVQIAVDQAISKSLTSAALAAAAA